jgi:hypothetical protein
MAVEPVTSVNRQVVPITWDTDKLDGEIIVIHCTNTETGGVSNSGYSKNDGSGIISYPLGYAGTTFVQVLDNHGNVDEGYIAVDGQGNASTPEPPDPPIDVIPPDPVEPPDELPPEDLGPPHVDNTLPGDLPHPEPH